MSNQTFRFLSAQDVKQCLSMVEAIALMKDAFIQLSNQEAAVPVRLNMPMPQDKGTALFMPVYLPQKQFGLKIASVMDENPDQGLPLIQAMVMVFDSQTGYPLALMDGEYLTALRTGAASGLATDLLARKDSDTVAIFGAGVQARFQLEAVCQVRMVKKAFVLNRSRDKAELFALEMSERLALPVETSDSTDVLRQVDMICTATSATAPLFEHADLKPGVHINAIGAFTAQMCEVPAATVQNAKVVVDQAEACRREAGDIIQAQKLGSVRIHAEIGEIAAGNKAGRESETEITFFKSVGNAVQDLAVANQALLNAEKLGLGQQLSL